MKKYLQFLVFLGFLLALNGCKEETVVATTPPIPPGVADIIVGEYTVIEIGSPRYPGVVVPYNSTDWSLDASIKVVKIAPDKVRIFKNIVEIRNTRNISVTDAIGTEYFIENFDNRGLYNLTTTKRGENEALRLSFEFYQNMTKLLVLHVNFDGSPESYLKALKK